MMIIRNVWPVVLMTGCLLLATGVQAAEADKSVAGGKSTISLSADKVIHACARKTVPELTEKALPFQQSIHTYAQKYRVDADLIRSVITIESCYQPKALSPKSARGLMQLIPATAERFGVSDVYDSQQNIHGGTRYLGWLSERFGGDLVKMLAAYNAGEGKVERYDGVPPYRETRHYVHDVLVVYKKFKQHRQMIADAEAKKQQAEQERQRQIQRVQQQQQRQARLTPQQLKQQPYTQQIIIGQTSQPLRRQPPPVLRKAGAKVIRNDKPPAQKQPEAAQRVKQVYASPFKPGRAGWQANKQLAPQLYKQ